MNGTRTGVVQLAALVLLAAGAASHARAAEPDWDPKQVIALAEKLVTILDESIAAAREAPPQATALQQRTRDAAVKDFQRVRQAADVFVSKLEAGWDRDMTVAYFRSVRDGFRDARQTARDAVPTEKAEENLRKANQVLSELSRHYPDA